VCQLPLPAATASGTFVPPTLIEIENISQIGGEVFGPVLHVIRYKRENIIGIIDAINATGFGLTFGLHTRLDETIQLVATRIRAGNLYINRNVIGAVVGVQPFGGRGLSGTGPKAGGPLYLGRLVQQAPRALALSKTEVDTTSVEFANWLESKNEGPSAIAARETAQQSLLGYSEELPGSVGESNHYTLHPRGKFLLLPETPQGLFMQVAAVLATGNSAEICADENLLQLFHGAPDNVTRRLRITTQWDNEIALVGALIEGSSKRVQDICFKLSTRSGQLVSVQSANGLEPYLTSLMMEETVISTNTTAAGGNASLMTM